MEIDIIRTNIRDMLESRGDDVSWIQEHGDAVIYDNPERFYKEVITLNTDKTTVFFALTKDILKEKLLKELKEEKTSQDIVNKYDNTKNFIIVTIDVPSVKQSILQFQIIDKSLQSIGGLLQIFYMDELRYNPTSHRLVPKHEKLNESQTKKVMEDYRIKSKSQFPLILKTDPIAKWLGLKHGDIVKITHINNNSGEYFYYRCAV
jgi:DNA-directed RNA polymerase subunit H (RpoH/RPB5)